MAANRSPRLSQSSAGKVREHLSEIEDRLYVGVTRAGVLDEFMKKGIDLGSLSSFPKALLRARVAAKTRVRDKAPVDAQTPISSDEPSPPKPASADAPASPASPMPSGQAFDRQALRKIMESQPDLDHYARLARERKGKKI